MYVHFDLDSIAFNLLILLIFAYERRIGFDLQKIFILNFFLSD